MRDRRRGCTPVGRQIYALFSPLWSFRNALNRRSTRTQRTARIDWTDLCGSMHIPVSRRDPPPPPENTRRHRTGKIPRNEGGALTRRGVRTSHSSLPTRGPLSGSAIVPEGGVLPLGDTPLIVSTPWQLGTYQTMTNERRRRRSPLHCLYCGYGRLSKKNRIDRRHLAKNEGTYFSPRTRPAGSPPSSQVHRHTPRPQVPGPRRPPSPPAASRASPEITHSWGSGPTCPSRSTGTDQPRPASSVPPSNVPSRTRPPTPTSRCLPEIDSGAPHRTMAEIAASLPDQHARWSGVCPLPYVPRDAEGGWAATRARRTEGGGEEEEERHAAKWRGDYP
mmetsp:Transcript_23553/g.69731  ORF Transcript_23553/g.69731 Transcript_23553/m.69731 type:complete len:334 (-) Transcript_23553:1255-2256(-)